MTPSEIAPRRNMARHLPGLIAAFIGEECIAGGLALDALIPRDRLNFHIDSLVALDEYLLKLRANMSHIDEKTMTLTVFAAGCYLGEVIRRCASVQWDWLNYDDYFPQCPRLASVVPYNLGTCVILEQPRGALTLPIHKVGHFLKDRDGPEYTSYSYAQWELSRGSGDGTAARLPRHAAKNDCTPYT
jgi:hypothetical protein